MMTSRPTIVLAGETAQLCQAPWIDQALERVGDDAAVERISIQALTDDPKWLGSATIVWIVLESKSTRIADAIMGIAQERHLLVMISRPDDNTAVGASTMDGFVAAPADADPEGLASAIRTLLTQAPMVQSMATEMQIMQLHHTGVCDQIDKMDEELRLAAQLQREFLPADLPRLHRVEFKALFRPAGYVSGDIYDVQRLDDEHIGFFVADAVGHGVPAALMTMFIKRSLRVKEIDPNLPKGYRIIPPNEALAQLNRDLIEHQSDAIRTATACYGVINSKTLELQFARAGHPYPFILRANGAETLEPDGGLLGVFPDGTYDLATTHLQPGDRLLLYSDGFEVAFPTAGGPIASDQYTEEFRDLGRGPIDEALQRLIDKLDGQTGSLNQRDDMTVVCLNVHEDE